MSDPLKGDKYMLTSKIFAAAQSGAEGILWLLIVLSLISFTIIFERFFSLYSIKKSSDKINKRLKDALSTNNYEDLDYLSKDRDTLEGRALSIGIRHIRENGSDGLAESFNSFALMEKPKLERSLNFLATIGSNAPFIGLLGTVLGIMKAFKDLSGAQGNVSVVMTGIAEALVATAVGLFVAIPAVMAYNYFQRQVKGILTNLEAVKEMCVAYATQLRK